MAKTRVKPFLLCSIRVYSGWRCTHFARVYTKGVYTGLKKAPAGDGQGCAGTILGWQIATNSVDTESGKCYYEWQEEKGGNP